MTDYFYAGQQLTAADLNAIPRPIVGDWLSADGSATSGATELLVCTTPAFTPIANMIYHVKFVFRFAAGTNAASDIYFTRIRLDTIAGTELRATRQPDYGSATTPLQGADCDYWFDSGSSPSSRAYVGTVIRSSGDGTVTPLASTSLVVSLVGTATDFT